MKTHITLFDLALQNAELNRATGHLNHQVCSAMTLQSWQVTGTNFVPGVNETGRVQLQKAIVEVQKELASLIKLLGEQAVEEAG